MMRRLVTVATTVAFVTLVNSAAHAQAPGRVTYAVRSLHGDEVRVGAGQPVTLVAVFATWCRSCRAEFATLDSLRAALAPRGVRVLALSVDEGDDAKVMRWTDARHTALLVAHDGSGAVGRTFGTVGVPESYLVDTLGIVRWRAVGDIDAHLVGLRAALAARAAR